MNFKYDKKNIELRRGRTLELAAKGMSQESISKTLGVHPSTTSLDLQYIKCKAQEHLQTHIQDTVVLQWEKTMSGLQQVLQRVWNIAETSERMSEKLQAYSLINDCYKYINDMSTDSTIISKALKFVLDNNKEQLQQPQNQKSQQEEEEQEQQTESSTEQQEELTDENKK
jgi:predicted transcriptional regulator